MKHVGIVSVRIQNFKSFANEVDVFFPGGGFNYLGGINDVEPELGANGAGKSSLWDAIVFGLYGTDALGNRASDLVTHGRKRCFVSVAGHVDGEDFEIDRWGNPNTLHVNNEPSDQDNVDRILGLNRARFLQSVLFAQKSRQFLDMTANERGELMDDVLDLGMWMEKSEYAGKLAKGYQEEIRGLEIESATLTGKIAGPEELTRLSERVETWKATKEQDLTDLNDKIDTLGQAVETGQDAINKLDRKIEDIPSLIGLEMELASQSKRAADLYQDRERLKGKHKTLLEQNFFLRDNKECMLCGQEISASHSHELHQANEEYMSEILDKMREVDLEKSNLTVTMSRLREKLDDETDKKRDLERKLAAAKYQKSSDERLLKFHLDLLDKEVSRGNPHLTALTEAEEHNERIAADITRIDSTLTREHEELRRMEYWRTGFKKVRLFLVKQALDVLTMETRNAASVLGLVDWDISYVTEVETKSGSLKAGIQVLVKSPHVGGIWKLQSGGEEQRVRIAITIGIASMIQRMAGVEYGLEVWDEPTAHLSPEGIADMLECLRYRSEETKKAVWIVDHQALSFGVFDSTWVVRKRAEGSDVEQTAWEEV
jgi:DNA repair exonuclease SbcCD ATPase subunit